MKTYIGITRDHSGSMQGIRTAAAVDYNNQIQDLKGAAASYEIDTIVSTVLCGIGPGEGRVEREHVNSNVQILKPIAPSSYKTNGNSTPLWDSVGELINIMKSVPDYADPEVSFVLMIFTDGGENCSRYWSADKLTREMRALQSTDRWTITWRVPTGSRRHLMSMGIPDGNIYEWDGRSQESLQTAGQATSAGINTYYANKVKGIHSTQKFYADLSKVSAEQVAAVCEDVSAQVQLWPISIADDGAELRKFVETRTGKPLLKGSAFYELVKTEPKVQSYKKIVIRDRNSNAIYGGQAARQLLGLPSNVDIRLAPDKSKTYDIFIQSTSVNRKLAKGTQLLYWPNVGVPFKEGISRKK